jgi:hypothetical protein
MTIVSSIHPFEPKLIMMFFHINSIREFITLVQSWAFVTLAIIVIAIRGERINKGENQ